MPTQNVGGAVAGVVTVLLRRSSAFVRNMVWVFALVGLILLPAFSLFSPLWNLPIIPELSSWGMTAYTPDYAKPDQDTSAGPSPVPPAGTREATGRSDSMPTSVPWRLYSEFPITATRSGWSAT